MTDSPTPPVPPPGPGPIERVPKPAEARATAAQAAEAQATAKQATVNTHNLNARMRRVESVCPLLRADAASGGVEPAGNRLAPPSAPLARMVASSGATMSAGVGSQLSVEGDDLQWQSKPIRIKGGAKLLKSLLGTGGVAAVVMCCMFAFGGMRPVAGDYSRDRTVYRGDGAIAAPGYAELRAFAEAVRWDDASWWNLTPEERELGEAALRAAGGGE